MRYAKFRNGEYIDMTTEEIEAFKRWQEEQPDTPAPTPTIEERVASVEEDTAVIRAILLGEEGETK